MSLLEKYYFYADYHQNKYNKAIHYVCIPLLVWTLFIFTNYINFDSILVTKKSSLFEEFQQVQYCTFNIRGSLILLGLYHVYYCYLSFRIGVISFLFYGSIWYLASLSYCLDTNIWIPATYLHLLSWVLQILGHAVFEHNKPAFTTSLKQSFLMAPLFVVYDLGMWGQLW